MRIGKLGERVRIEAPIYAKDALGDALPVDWGTPIKRWAEVRGGPPGVEQLSTEQVVATQGYEIEIRYTEGITPKHSIVLRGRRLQIQSVRSVGPRGRKTLIVAVETDDPTKGGGTGT